MSDIISDDIWHNDTQAWSDFAQADTGWGESAERDAAILTAAQRAEPSPIEEAIEQFVPTVDLLDRHAYSAFGSPSAQIEELVPTVNERLDDLLPGRPAGQAAGQHHSWLDVWRCALLIVLGAVLAALAVVLALHGSTPAAPTTPTNNPTTTTSNPYSQCGLWDPWCYGTTSTAPTTTTTSPTITTTTTASTSAALPPVPPANLRPDFSAAWTWTSEYNSTSPDGSFLRLLHRDNVGYDSPGDAIAAAHWVCLPANQRRPIGDVGADVARANPELSAHGAAGFVASAITAYCPDGSTP
jgi:hypothetical protein